MAYIVKNPKYVHLTKAPNKKSCEVCGKLPENLCHRTTSGEYSDKNISAGMVVSKRQNRMKLRPVKYPDMLVTIYTTTNRVQHENKLACDDCSATYYDPYDWYYNRKQSSTEIYIDIAD